MNRKPNTTDTNKAAKPALLPKLRFPEFRGTQGWEDTPLGTLLKKSPDYGVNAAAVPFTDCLPQYLRITDISDDGTYLSDKKVSVDLEPREENFLEEGDIVLARTGASVGKSYRYRKDDGRLVFAGFLIRVRPNQARLDSTYLANFLTTTQYWKWVEATSARSGQPGINSVEYGSLGIPLPAVFAEQQKIAECLSSVDEAIAAQARKLDALKTHKKGLMQQLFPREGEAQPCLRFPEFQNAGEWEVRPFGELVDDIIDFRGRTPAKLGMEWGGGNITSLSANNVKNGFIDYAAECNWGSEQLYQRWMGDVNLEKDDIVFTMEAPLGKALLLPGSQKYILSQRVVAFKTKPTVRNPFLIQLIWSEGFQTAIDGLATGSTAKGINQKALKTVPAKLPKPLEQQHIAECLSSLDDLIAAEKKKHAALQRHKRGLMQQLFPSPDMS